MDIKKLICFITIVESGDYTTAAQKLFVSQAALSKQIISLEKELNVTLFDRSKRKNVLTEAGHILMSHVPTLIKDYKETLAALHTGNQKLVIASMPIMVQYGITKLISDFSNQYPTVQLSVLEINNDNISFGLSHNEYALAFVRRDGLDLSRLEAVDIFQDQLVLIMSKQHPLASQTSISLEQFKHDNFLFLNTYTTLYDHSYNACLQAGFEPNVIFSGERAENIAELVSANIGVALLMEQVAQGLSDNIAIAPLQNMPHSYISLVRPRGGYRSDSERMFWAYVKQRGLSDSV